MEEAFRKNARKNSQKLELVLLASIFAQTSIQLSFQCSSLPDTQTLLLNCQNVEQASRSHEETHIKGTN